MVSIICEGHDHAPDKAGEIFKEALDRTREVAASF